MNNLSIGDFYLQVRSDFKELSLIDFKEIVAAVLPKSTNIFSTTLLTVVDQHKISKLLAKYKVGTPVVYLTKTIDFYGYRLNVSNKVLIPRVETEQLIDISKSFILDKNLSNNQILEVGIGSGCIITTLANELEKALVSYEYLGIDISQDATKCTTDNLALFPLKSKVSIKTTSLLNYIKSPSPKAFHYIVSNPPYLTEDQMLALDTYVKKEPVKALSGGKDGLKYYKQILKLAQLQQQRFMFLPTLFLEADPAIMKSLITIFSKTYAPGNISIVADLFGLDRFIIIQAP